MAIEYVFVDTCVLSDIIRQYNPLCPRNPLQEGNYLKKDMLRYVNQIITDVEDNGYIIASTFAFVELINKLDDIFSGSVSKERLLGVVNQPPSWFIVEDMNKDTAIHFCDVPASVGGTSISSDDAIHVATAMQRGDALLFLTTDQTISKLSLPKITFVNS